MCQICLDSLKEIFPHIPKKKRVDFLFGTTCFPFGTGEQTRAQLLELRKQMKTTCYHECYAIAEEKLDEAMEKMARR